MNVTTVSFLVFVISLLAAIILDLGVITRKHKVITLRHAFYQSVFWIGLSLAYFAFLWAEDGSVIAMKYLTAYVMEKSLSIDNVFVFVLIFSFFKVEEEDVARALFIGVILAIVLRIIFIAAGIEIINHFHWVLYLFGAFLLYTGFRLFFKKDEEEYDPGHSAIYRWCQKLFRISTAKPNGKYIREINGKIYLTSLALVVLMLAATDVVFAVDSIPTVVSLVKEGVEEPFTPQDILVIYSSNIFAVLGLRALFFVLRGAVDKFRHLQQGIAVVLAFIGIKMLLEFFDIHIPIYFSMIFILVSISASIWYSWRQGTDKRVRDIH